MRVELEMDYRLQCELRTSADLTGAPLASRDVTEDLADLIDEAIVSEVLADRLPADIEQIQVRLEPIWHEAPLVSSLRLELHGVSSSGGAVGSAGPRADVARYECTAGRWSRWALRQLAQLREEGTVAATQPIYSMLLAVPDRHGAPMPLPVMALPIIPDATLDECGVVSIGTEEWTPDRPLLVGRRFEQEAIERCMEAGTRETGAAVVGRVVRLTEPLAGSVSRIVTLFSDLAFDARHIGSADRFDFHPAALVEAQRICELRGMGESVLTVFHSHGWGCGDCNQKAG